MEGWQKTLIWAAAFFGGAILLKPGVAGDEFSTPNLPTPLLIHTAGTAQSTGTEYPLTHLPMTWASGQTCAFVMYMKNLLAGSGIAGRAAQLFIAHMGRETGFGRNVYGNNFGNVQAYHAEPYMRLPDHLSYKVYESPRVGINAEIALLRDSARYGHAFQQMIAGDKNWYSTLGIAGWYQYRQADGTIVNTTASNVGASQADYERTLASVEHCWSV